MVYFTSTNVQGLEACNTLLLDRDNLCNPGKDTTDIYYTEWKVSFQLQLGTWRIFNQLIITILPLEICDYCTKESSFCETPCSLWKEIVHWYLVKVWQNNVIDHLYVNISSIALWEWKCAQGLLLHRSIYTAWILSI